MQSNVKLENRQRRYRASCFIDRISKSLALPNHVACTAKYYVQHFYVNRSFLEFDFAEVSTGALLLAIKTCELLKSFRMPVFLEAVTTAVLGGNSATTDEKVSVSGH